MEEEKKQQQRMAIMKDLTKKIRSKGSMPKIVGWSWSCLRRIDCVKAWTHTRWEDTMQKWCEWLEYRKEKDEKEKWRRCISETRRR